MFLINIITITIIIEFHESEILRKLSRDLILLISLLCYTIIDIDLSSSCVFYSVSPPYILYICKYLSLHDMYISPSQAF